jgi:hypothetical protein
MPSGIILSSGSQGATQEDIEKVLNQNGYEADKPEVTTVEAVEPKRDDFESDEAFEQAQEEFEVAQQEAADKEEREEEERQRQQEERHPKLSRRQRAIDKATKELKDQNRKLEERLAALEGKGGKKTEAEPEPVAKIVAPKREDFATDAEFDDAMFDHRYKLRRAKEEAEGARNAQQNRLKANFESYQAAVADFKDEHDDWDEVVNQKIPILDSVYLTIQELENGPAVTYYLGKHPAYAQKLAEMSSLAAVVEVGRLADRLKTGAPNRGEADGAAKPKPKPKTIPEPVKPVSTSATASSLSSADAAKNRNYRAFKVAQRSGR